MDRKGLLVFVLVATLLPALAGAAVLTVDPGDAAVGYRIPGTSLYNVSGVQSADLAPGSYQLCIVYTCVPFTLAADGTVSGAANDALDFVGGTLQFRPAVAITVDPGDAEVGYRVPSTQVYNVSGVQTGLFVPGTEMDLCVERTCRRFFIDAGGNVSGPDNPSFAYAGATISFRPSVTIAFDAADAEVAYRVPGTAVYNVSGLHTARLVPGTGMNLCVVNTCVPWEVNPDGTASGPANGSFAFDGATIRFNTVPVAVTPSDPAVGFRIPSTQIYNVSGSHAASMVAGVEMTLCVASTCAAWTVSDPCDQHVLVLGTDFHLVCGARDADGDGVLDEADACPNADPQGTDADGDGCLDDAEALSDIVTASPLPPEVQSSVQAKVAAAEAAIERGSVAAAKSQLQAFIRQVTAQRGKKIDPATADLLIAFAANVLGTL